MIAEQFQKNEFRDYFYIYVSLSPLLPLVRYMSLFLSSLSAQRILLRAIYEICLRDRDRNPDVHIIPGDLDLVISWVSYDDGVGLVLSCELGVVMLFDDVTGLAVDDGDDEVGARVRVGFCDGDQAFVAEITVPALGVGVHLRVDFEVDDHRRDLQVEVERYYVIEQIDLVGVYFGVYRQDWCWSGCGI